MMKRIALGVILAGFVAACEESQPRPVEISQIDEQKANTTKLIAECKEMGGSPILETAYVWGDPYFVVKWCVPPNINPRLLESLSENK